MKLTLRKANAVQAAINEAIKACKLETTVTLNEFEDVSEQIDVVRAKLLGELELRNDLMKSLYDIRAKVSQANATAGINDLLAELAYFDKQIAVNNLLAGKGVQTSLTVLNGKVKKNAELKDDAYAYNRSDVSTSVFTEEEISEFKTIAADFKKRKQKNQDKLLELNVETKIELDKDTVAVLKKAEIL